MSKIQQKSQLLKQFKKTPIVQVACLRLGINRTTYYRWRKSDIKFAHAADEAMAEGWELMNDMAELQLITAIKNNDIKAVIFWLKHHHPSYRNKVEVSGKLRSEPETEELTPEQQNLVEKALKMIGMPSKSV